MLLESMKKGIGKYVMIVLASLLILSFAVWGIGDMAGVISNPDEVATVGETKITQREFHNHFRREIERIRSRVGKIDAQQARDIGLANATVDGLISKRLILLQAAELGLLISDEQVVRRIQQEPAFRNTMGRFDRLVFQNTLANNALSEDMYVASLREETQQAYIGGTITAGIEAPPNLVSEVYQYRNELRTAEVVRIKRSVSGKVPAPNEAQLIGFLEKNSSAFMAPEYRRLSILHLDPEKVARELSPSEDRIRSEYEDRLTSLSVPERRQLQQILLQDEESSKKAYASLNEGRSFEAVAAEVSGKPEEDIKLGLITRRDILPKLADAAFALQNNQFTKPQKSPMGWHIIRVTEIKPGREPKLEEVRKQISDELARDLALDDLIKQANRLEDALAGGGTITDVASDIGAKIFKTELIDASGKSQTGTDQVGLPLDEIFAQTAFTLKKGETSDLIELSNGGYFMVRVDETIKAVRRGMNQVRSEVRAAWQAKWLNNRARKTAEEIRDAVKSGTPLLSAASDKGLIVETSKPLSRFSSLSDSLIPPSIIRDLFDAKARGIVIGPTSDGYAFVRVKDIRSANMTTSDAGLKQLRETLSFAIANDVLQQYTQSLRAEYSVTINQAVLENYFSREAFGRR